MVDQGKVNKFRYRVFITEFNKTDLRYFRSIEYMIDTFKKDKLYKRGRIEIQALIHYDDFNVYDVVAIKNIENDYFYVYTWCPNTLAKFLWGCI